MALNKTFISGRITATPELRKTTTGKSVTTICVACDRRKKDDGTDFFEVVAWEGLAEYITNYGRKGCEIIVCGRLTQRKYTDKAGVNRTANEIVAEEVLIPKVKGEEAVPLQDGEPLPF